MIRIDQFEVVFPPNPAYKITKRSLEEVEACREDHVDGKLFFERLLDVLHIKASYPPKDKKDLRELHRVIVASSCPEHHKQSLFYYLLKDYCSASASEDLADAFQKSCFLPNKYWICMQGLWYMDKKQWKSAIEYLSQPSLLPVFSAEVLRTLLKNDNEMLALAYYHAVQPSITDPALHKSFFIALSHASVTEAFYFIRRQAPETRQELLGILIDETLQNVDPGEYSANVGVELIDLPFDEDEEVWFEAYLSKGKGSKTAHGGDALLTRWMARGKWDSVLEKSKTVDASTKQHDGVNWESLVEGVSRGVGDRVGLENWKVD